MPNTAKPRCEIIMDRRGPEGHYDAPCTRPAVAGDNRCKRPWWIHAVAPEPAAQHDDPRTLRPDRQ